jgi:vacuolar-type H+-ATPase subunit D/Vma8
MPDHATDSRMERIAESTGAKFTVRVLVPVVMLVTLPLLTVIYGGIREDVSSVREKQELQDTRMGTMERNMDQLGTKLDAGLTWRVAELERRFTLMEQRIDYRREARQTP